MIPSRFIAPWLIGLAAFLLRVPDLDAESYEEEKIREQARDLRKARESLHEAHLELARKTGRVASLEALLKENGIDLPPEPDLPPLESEKERETKAKLSEAIEKIRELEKRLLTGTQGEMTGEAKRKHRAPDGNTTARSASETARGASILIEYTAGSAVNLAGREKVFRFIVEVLERSPSARFRVEGGADDTQYESSDSVIAENRVRFLVDFLKYKKLSGEIFAEIESTSTKGKSAPKKFVRVSVISG